MKVIQQSADHIVLGERTWILGTLATAMILLFVYFGIEAVIERDPWGYALGLFGVAFGGLIFAIFVRRSQAVLDRTTGLLTLRSRSVFRYRERRWPLTEIERAIVEKMNLDDGEGYRPTLLMRSGEPRRVPLTVIYSSGSGAERVRDAINDWLGKLDSGAEAP